MNAPQITMIVLFAINFAFNASRHGEVREKPFNQYNLWVSLLRLIVIALILRWGGFWS